MLHQAAVILRPMIGQEEMGKICCQEDMGMLIKANMLTITPLCKIMGMYIIDKIMANGVKIGHKVSPI